MNRVKGESTWLGLVEILGLKPISKKHHMVWGENDNVKITVPLEKDLYLSISGEQLEVREIRTRYFKTNQLKVAGTWKSNPERWNVPEESRTVADILDWTIPLLGELEGDYPHIESINLRAREWVKRLDNEHRDRISKHKLEAKRTKRRMDLWAFSLIGGVILLFLYVSGTGDPNRCVYINDPRGGYLDC